MFLDMELVDRKSLGNKMYHEVWSGELVRRSGVLSMSVAIIGLRNRLYWNYSVVSGVRVNFTSYSISKTVGIDLSGTTALGDVGIMSRSYLSPLISNIRGIGTDQGYQKWLGQVGYMFGGFGIMERKSWPSSQMSITRGILSQEIENFYGEKIGA